MNGYRDALQAIKVIEKNKQNGYKYTDFSSYSPCYKFSNENLAGYYPKFNMNNGRVLTVCGSGDQVLSSILYGAENVDCFDSNILTYYNLMLKIYCIKNLSFDDFLWFFGLSNYDYDRKLFYDSFREKIDNKDVRVFFDLLFDCGFNINYLYNNSDICYPENLISSIPYLNKDNYYKLKNKIDISKIKFAVCDLFDIYKYYDSKYDFINFSNICDYIDNLIPFYKFINTSHAKHLNNNGCIMVTYSWTRPYYNETNNMTAEMVGAYQTKIETNGYNDDYDSIVYLKK